MNAPVHPPVAPPQVDTGPGSGGAVRLLRRLMFDPVGMIEDFQRRHGQVFTIQVPFGLTPPFTFLTTRQGYGAVLNPAAERGQERTDHRPRAGARDVDAAE